MTHPPLAERLPLLFDRFTAAERAGIERIQCLAELPPRRFEHEAGLPAEVVPAEDGTPTLVVREGALGEAPSDEEILAALAFALDRHHEDLLAAEALPNEERLLEAQAQFREGAPLPAGWYRQGAPLGPGVWLVDLDLFVELVVEEKSLSSWPARELTLIITEDPMTFDLPDEASVDEFWQVPDVGLSEDDDEEGPEDPNARSGDLYIVPCPLPTM